MTDIFTATDRPKPDLLFHKNDPNDVRLGETVRVDPADYESADVVLLGLPQDEGVRRNGGRVGASAAPDAIRASLYKLVALDRVRLFDLGNTIVQPTLEETHDLHQTIARQILRDGKTLIVLGGGNDTSYPDCSALALEAGAPIVAFNVDAHFDVRADTVRNSGTPYRQLLEEGFVAPEHFHEIGYQPFANSATYVRYLADKGVTTFSREEVGERGIAVVLRVALEKKPAGAIFWGLDMDVVTAADAPGVSAINPTGLSGREFYQVAQIAGSEPRTRLFEISEVNPAFDIDGRTCRLAAAAVWTFLAAVEGRGR
ncbi:MAG: formimidoylglutamase [Anaerolineae bacterium]|nr:formimidoylglutamase [Anaerolineae bacterium]